MCAMFGSGSSPTRAACSSRRTMTEFQAFLIAALATFLGFGLLVPIVLALVRMAGLYAIVEERPSRVYVLFGKVLGVLDEPGFHFLLARLGPAALVVNWPGRCYLL